MKNLIIFSPFALENKRGGEFFSLELAHGLKKYYNVTLIDTNRRFNKKLKLKGQRIFEDIQKLKRIRFATLNIFNMTFDFPIPSELIKLFKEVKRCDIAYILISTFKTELIFMFFSLIFPHIKFIVGYHKPLYSDKKFSLYNLKYRLSILFFSILNINVYHHAISNHSKIFLENFFKKNQVIYIREGVNLKRYLLKSNSKDEKILKFLFVGSLDDHHKGFGVLLRGIDLFLQKYNHLSISFEMCGTGPLELQLRTLLKKYPKHIKYHGFVDLELLSQIYSKNDVFLFSSRREPFGRVIIEALASEMVIICSKTIGSIEILKGQEFAFFLSDLNPKSISEKIFKVYKFWKEDFKRFRQLQEVARKFVISKYAIENEIEDFHNFFKSLLKKIS